MSFQSILFIQPVDLGVEEEPGVPEFFSDLNLDQIVNAIVTDKREYNLKPLFYRCLTDIQTIQYRQEIMCDMEDQILSGNVKSFAQKMRAMHRSLTLLDKLDNIHHKAGWFLEAVEVYCDAVTCLANDLNSAAVKSGGLRAFREYINGYVNSDSFNWLLGETGRLKTSLSNVRYCVLINDNCVKVSRYESEIDYSAEVEKAFEKFKQGEVKDYKTKLPIRSGLNHVEAQILDIVAGLFSDVFGDLHDYYAKNLDFADPVISVFEREIQFYIAYLAYIEKPKRAGLDFCYPAISDSDKEVFDYGGFDLALADKLIEEGLPVVSNDFYLKGQERIFVVSGPNQGGKTTFARMFAQLHFWAGLGCPVPGTRAKLFLYNGLFTHFEREENMNNLSGKLLDDLVRFNHILNRATQNSIVVINEIFSSTTLKDAVWLSKEIMRKIVDLDVLCVWVTFIDELASYCDKTVSMVSTVYPDNPDLRTFKLVRKPADGLSYAISIAEKHRLTYDRLKERIKS